jgi:hypothetical protein
LGLLRQEMLRDAQHDGMRDAQDDGALTDYSP